MISPKFVWYVGGLICTDRKWEFFFRSSVLSWLRAARSKRTQKYAPTQMLYIHMLSWLSQGISHHDDVIKWKHFSRYWPFVGDFTGELPGQRPVTRRFGAFFDLRLNKRVNKQSWGWWFETTSSSLLLHCNVEGFIMNMPNFNTYHTPFNSMHLSIFQPGCC